MEYYTYKATVERVIDGDTIQVLVDLGFKIFMSHRFRLVGVYAAERGETKYGVHIDYAKQLLPVGEKITIKTVRDSADKYGRYLATVFKDNVNINESIQTLIGEKHGNF